VNLFPRRRDVGLVSGDGSREKKRGEMGTASVVMLLFVTRYSISSSSSRESSLRQSRSRGARRAAVSSIYAFCGVWSSTEASPDNHGQSAASRRTQTASEGDSSCGVAADTTLNRRNNGIFSDEWRRRWSLLLRRDAGQSLRLTDNNVRLTALWSTLDADHSR